VRSWTHDREASQLHQEDSLPATAYTSCQHQTTVGDVNPIATPRRRLRGNRWVRRKERAGWSERHRINTTSGCKCNSTIFGFDLRCWKSSMECRRVDTIASASRNPEPDMGIRRRRRRSLSRRR
jgi:hypothetical protein